MRENGNIFRVDLRLLVELGERLISRDEITIVELVKNAYDADARIVEVIIKKGNIEIRDDGIGMNKDEIVEGWLTLGTGIKKRKTRTPSGRRVLGEKGLGRLALLRLGEKVIIHTRAKGNPCYKLTMDWGEAKKKLEEEEYTPMSEMKVEIEEVEDGCNSLISPEHGTTIKIESLKTEWTDKKIENLRRFLTRLVDPEESDNTGFKIYMIVNGKKEAISPPDIIEYPHYYLEADIDEEGKYVGELKWNLRTQKGSKKIQGNIKPRRKEDGQIYWKSVREGGVGPFKFRLKAWDLDTLEKNVRRDIRPWTGISLTRDGFRVVQPDVDWLGLNLRRVQNPTMRLSTNQLMGNVFISSDTNPNIIDKTDREGVVENEAVTILKESVSQLMEIVEIERRKLRKAKSLTRGTIFKYLDTTPLKQIAQKLPADQRREIKEYSSRVDEFRRLLEEWILGRDRMATIGMLGARLLHEARSALMKITDNYPLIEEYLDDLPAPYQKYFKRMVDGGRMLSKIFKELDPFIKFRRIRKQEINLVKVIESLEFLFGPELRKQKIKIKNNIPTNITFKAGETDIYVIFANLLDNSIYWLSEESKREEKIIEFRAAEENDSLILEIADSGPGIDPAIVDIIFEPGFTTKSEGTGLGLAIVRDIVDFYGGRIEVGEDKKIGGALFHIELPYEGK